MELIAEWRGLYVRYSTALATNSCFDEVATALIRETNHANEDRKAYPEQQAAFQEKTDCSDSTKSQSSKRQSK
jgi:hypothetical protein